MSDEKGTDRQHGGSLPGSRSESGFLSSMKTRVTLSETLFVSRAKRRRVAIGGCRRRAVCAPATVRSRGRRREFGANLTFASMGVAKTCGDGGTGGGREGTGRQSTGLDFVTGSLRGLLSPAGELYGPSSRRRARSRSPRGRVGATADDKTKQSDRFAHLSSHCCLGTCHVAVMCVASTSR